MGSSKSGSDPDPRTSNPPHRSHRPPMEYLAHFFAGAFLCNCLPHLVAGLQGAPFPTPFAKPRGVGLSPALTNFYWGLFNLLLGAGLCIAFPVRAELSLSTLAFAAGVVSLGSYVAVHFSAVHKTRDPLQAAANP